MTVVKSYEKKCQNYFLMTISLRCSESPKSEFCKAGYCVLHRKK